LADRLRKERRHFIQVLLGVSLTASVVLMTIGAFMWSTLGLRTAEAVVPGKLFGPLDAGNRLMLAGIVLLALTPALQVGALLVLWVRERAWRFVVTAALVLMLLAVALWVGGG
jgi:hypothetical protein